jgi:hypothetical protein
LPFAGSLTVPPTLRRLLLLTVIHARIGGPHVGPDEILFPGLIKIYTQLDRESRGVLITGVLVEIQSLCLWIVVRSEDGSRHVQASPDV